ncbi:MAG TPA: aminodeoxychorismate lyase [Steroidobacteraceae bacterium]|nr:aminodeoxychorismate lyase [Steroidobacteraceae bacterium]
MKPPQPAGASELVLVNGQAAGAGISWFDRGLHYGDGLFETIACRRGVARFLEWHLERLSLGCERLRIPLHDLSEVRDEVRKLAREVDSAIIKLMLTRGSAVARGYAPTGSEKPTRITFRQAWPSEDPAARQDGVRVRIAALRLGENPALAGLKHLNRLEQVLAKMESMDTPSAQSAQETLLFSSSGRLVSGSMTNLFIVRGSCVQTPRIDLCGVAGVMRRVVLSEAVRVGIPVEECALRAEDLQDAQEIFLTNARIGIWPVRALESRVLSPGPITRRLQEHLRPLLEDPGDA